MDQLLFEFWSWLRPEFSRTATFENFKRAFAGIIRQTDSLGVTAMVRAIGGKAVEYGQLLHLFRSTAWDGSSLLLRGLTFASMQSLAVTVNGRMCFLMDDSNVPKDGVRMPYMGIVHQNSETSSKPSYFRGQTFGAVAMLANSVGKDFAIPASVAFYQPGKDSQEDGTTRTHKLTTRAISVVKHIGKPAYLIGDAWFNNKTATELVADTKGLVQLVSRARIDAVGYMPPPKRTKKQVAGRPRKYGRKISLRTLFKKHAEKFEVKEAYMYGKRQSVRVYAINLIRKPGHTIRFILAVTPRGKIVITSTDLEIDPVVALELYARRMPIEEMFDGAKNILNAKSARFWSKGMEKVSRRPTKNNAPRVITNPEAVEATEAAHEKKLQLTFAVLQFMQMVAATLGPDVVRRDGQWYRTPPRSVPSPRVARHAMAKVIEEFSAVLPWIREGISENYGTAPCVQGQPVGG